MLHDSVAQILLLPLIVPAKASEYDNTEMDSLRIPLELVLMGIATSVVAMLDVVAADGDWQLLGDQVLPIVRLDRCLGS